MLIRLLQVAAVAAVVSSCSDPTSLTTEPVPDETPPPEPGPTCISLCVRGVGDCDAIPLTESECRETCQRGLDAEYARDEACGMASEDVFLCAIELDCDGYREWWSPTSEDRPCRSEIDAFDQLVRDGICSGTS